LQRVGLAASGIEDLLQKDRERRSLNDQGQRVVANVEDVTPATVSGVHVQDPVVSTSVPHQRDAVRKRLFERKHVASEEVDLGLQVIKAKAAGVLE